MNSFHRHPHALPSRVAWYDSSLNHVLFLRHPWDALCGEELYLSDRFVNVFFKTCSNNTLQSYARVTTELSLASRSCGHCHCCCKGLVSCLPSRTERERERVLQILAIFFHLFWRCVQSSEVPYQSVWCICGLMIWHKRRRRLHVSCWSLPALASTFSHSDCCSRDPFQLPEIGDAFLYVHDFI